MSYYRTLIQSTLVPFLVSAYKLSDATDSYGGYNGTAGSYVVFNSTNAVDGNAGQFINSIDSRISIADNNAFSFTTGTADKPFSIKANINISTLGATNIIFGKYSGALNNTSEYLFYVTTANKLALILFDKNAGGVYIGASISGTVSSSTQYNIVATYDGSGSWTGIKLYINGTLQSLTALNNGTPYTSMGNTTTQQTIGNASSFGSPFRGTIDECYIFNKALSQSEITSLQTNYYPNI